MPVVEPGKEGIFANPVYGPPSVEQQKLGIFANPPMSKPGVSTTVPVNTTQSHSLVSKLAPGGFKLSDLKSPVPGNVKFGSNDGVNGATDTDWRVKVSINPTASILYKDSNPGILKILGETDGVIFPYVPSVTVSHSANYGSTPLTHTNYANFFYESSSVAAISITADFTVQNSKEAEYFLAIIYFFRACTKMFYGESGDYQGSPPPIVYLDGYGAHYLPHVPCVVTSFSHTMPPDVDYIEYATAFQDSSGYTYDSLGNPVSETGASEQSLPSRTRVPTASQFSLTLQPVYSRTAQRQFDYAAFARGDLISKQGGGGYL